MKGEPKTDPPPARHSISISKPEIDASFSDKDLKKLIREFEREMPSSYRGYRLRVNKEINRIVIKVVDLSTDKVIKEIPPKEIQHMLAGIRRALGLVVDKKI